MAKKDEKESQKSALGKGLAEVLARPAEGEEEGAGEEKDEKTLAQEFLLSVESRIKAVSTTDVDITDVEIEYLQARTAFAVGNFAGALDYLENMNKELEDLEKEAEKTKKETPPPKEEKTAKTEAPPPPAEEDEEEVEVEEGEEVLPEDMPMVYCMMCGEQITEDSLFCNWCGEKVN